MIRVRYLVARYCALIVHEVGHIAGLGRPVWDGGKWVDGHPTEASVMSNTAHRFPAACWRYAKQKIKFRQRKAW
jgi:hypothetical protein